MAEVDFGVDTLLEKLEATTKLGTRHYKPTRATSDQEKRRAVSLANQRQKRTDQFEAGRQVATVPKIEQDYELMLSEWFQEVPPDFETTWRMVVCPIGKRSLIIAKSGVTKVYTRKGIHINTFQSGLPGGSRGCYSGITVFDAIFCHQQATYFVLDVMVWNGHTLFECETEFRFYFLRSKLEETADFSEHNLTNQYSFSPLPNFPCQQDTLCAIMSHPVPYEIDGLLFYHHQGHYTAGETPLVLWMTPNMVADSIGIMPSQEFLTSQFPNSGTTRHQKKKARKKRQSMETEVQVETEARLVPVPVPEGIPDHTEPTFPDL